MRSVMPRSNWAIAIIVLLSWLLTLSAVAPHLLVSTRLGFFRWSSLVLGVIRSAPFQMRRVPGPEVAATTAAAGSRQ